MQTIAQKKASKKYYLNHKEYYKEKVKEYQKRYRRERTEYKERIDKSIELLIDLKQFVYDELVDRNISGATETHCKIMNILEILKGELK